MNSRCAGSVCRLGRTWVLTWVIAPGLCLAGPAQQKASTLAAEPARTPPATPSVAHVKNESERAEAEGGEVVRLFDGKTLLGWREAQFPASGKVKVEDGKLVLGLGYMTGVVLTNEVPRIDYEVNLEAMRVEGSDFFCALTFPVGKDPCTLIVGGWGGGLVGLSCLDYMDASSNETTQMRKFENGRWYKIRLRVVPGKIQAWIDGEQVVDVNSAERKISIRAECEPCLPFGIATWSTTGALRNITLRHL